MGPSKTFQFAADTMPIVKSMLASVSPGPRMFTAQ